MKTREKVLEQTRKILVGPNPLTGFTQDNGEEILFGDSPLKTYVTGILFPQQHYNESVEEVEEVIDDKNQSTEQSIGNEYSSEESLVKDFNVVETQIEPEISKINNFKQSAMGITFCVSSDAKELIVSVSVGAYEKKSSYYPVKIVEENEKRKLILSDKQKICYFRTQINSVLNIRREDLPTKEKRHKEYVLYDGQKTIIDGLVATITYRMISSTNNSIIYTVTLINTHKNKNNANDVENCWYQCEFWVETQIGMIALPSIYSSYLSSEDTRLNSLLYREVETYSIGHGCAAVWNDSAIPPNKICATPMPEYEVKPIVPAKVKAKLSMLLYSEDKDNTIKDLKVLCDEYDCWISEEKNKIISISNQYHLQTANERIELCLKCCERIREGIKLLESNDLCLQAFQLANKAMLMQQLHYKLPLVDYSGYDTNTGKFILAEKITLPDIGNKETWYNPNQNTTYGQWRAFQIAFILLNLNSLFDKNSAERRIVDLIWFPTGGGKTEAYLGLTAYTIFLRRLKNPEDSGTAVIMRYTLRLLTAQQYERAASLICSIEKIRSENYDLLGNKRITVGLWVGGDVTENNSTDVIAKINRIRSAKEYGNVSVVLKCPWCGASMETYQNEKIVRTPGYEIAPDKKSVIFRCGNHDCDFSKDNFDLPLNLFDDQIYKNPPTLLFGTVDKFAMLTYRVEAKSLFGGDHERTPPELIIQDELHLITGPLGSTVGLYETLIHELCIQNGTSPKIITSTATISGAKEQCNALYACGQDNVFQFPVQGISYRDCFFAFEDRTAVGRKYVGLYGAAASSSATASIFTFAALLYSAKSIEVENEIDRDPYWTNLAYFGSMRELGQTATWFIADIKEYLEVIYSNRLETSLPRTKRRYLYENGLAELTSRMSNFEIPKILKRLETKHSFNDNRALDVCLATNMISVGVDIPRLGLMTVTGQPKSMSEYIQATSRVGRDPTAPGLVLVIYNTSKSRDKSHYEKFQTQHSKLYFSIEPTSVTPFSRPLRERALHAILVALHRYYVIREMRNNASAFPTQDEFNRIVEIIAKRAEKIDPSEVDDIKKQLTMKYRQWRAWKPDSYFSFRSTDDAPLLVPAGVYRPSSWNSIGWDTPSSMRNVEKECGLDYSRALLPDEGEH